MHMHCVRVAGTLQLHLPDDVEADPRDETERPSDAPLKAHEHGVEATVGKQVSIHGKYTW